MKLLYLDCGMGAAGDMLMGALVSLLDKGEQESFIKEINSIGLPGVKVTLSDDEKCGIKCSHISVKIHGEEEETHDIKAHDHDHSHDHEEHGHDHHDHSHEHDHEHHHHEHHHATLGEVYGIIDGLNVSDSIKNNVKNIYEIIAKAEGKVHGADVTEVHFHEVGMMDAIADVTGNAMLIEKIGADKIVSSPVNTGFGKVKCAHGILDVPAPATAEIIKGMPTYAGKHEGEMCTPTGAAIVRYYAEEFGDNPVVIELRRGYGSGNKNFDEPNVVKAVYGTFES